MELIQDCSNCSVKNIKVLEDISVVGLCSKCSVRLTAYNRYWAANIPFEFWDTRMPKSIEDENKIFQGPKELIKIYIKATEDISKSYIQGLSFCLAGTHGVGKSYVISNILKKVCHKNFTALYSTLSDIINILTLSPSEDKYLSRKELIDVDFLAIDEMDPRFIGTSENASDLFGRTFEHIIRSRLQNKLPTIIVSNSPNPIEAFQSSLKVSLDSLMSKIPLIPILGKDYRKVLGSGENK